MAPFLIIVLVGFFACQDFFYYKSYVSSNGEPEHRYMWYLAQNFRILWVGDLTDAVDNYDWLEFAIFVLFALLIFIVLMNLLISIIGDSHEFITASLQKRTTLQLCLKVLELETFFAVWFLIREHRFCGKARAPTNLVFAEPYSKTTSTEWLGRVKEITNAITRKVD